MSLETESNSLTTSGITVKVETNFISEQTSAQNAHYSFAYRITIQNNSDYTVRLLSRKWILTDALGKVRTVEGEGVVGKQPVIAPGQSHVYVSGTNFPTPFGKMEGYYTMKRMLDEQEFEVGIPVFILEYPFVLN